jgi:hypothetical protein
VDRVACLPRGDTYLCSAQGCLLSLNFAKLGDQAQQYTPQLDQLDLSSDMIAVGDVSWVWNLKTTRRSRVKVEVDAALG